MSVHLTRLIRLRMQAHRAQRKQPSYPKFPSREWFYHAQRLVELQNEFGLSRLGASGKHMRRLLGPHLGGQWTSNLDTLRKWQPRLILVHQPEVDKVQQARAACPDAIIVGRFYHDDNHYASNINARPKEFAREIHNEIANHPVTPLLDYAQSNNETNQDWQGIQKLNIFTQEWMALADQSRAYKCAILAFSVGNPDMPHKPGDPAGFDGRMLYWQQVLPSLNYAQANGHVLLLHAYGYPDMFHPNADWYIYRYERQVQANLKTLGITKLKYLYGEIGIDRLIVNGKGGYKVVTNDQDYVNQLLQWEKDQQGQELLLGGAIFTAGDSGGWDTYDIFSTNVASMIATHYADHAGDYESAPTGTSEPVQTHLPSISPGTSTVEPSLPPRQIDPRLTERGVAIETPQVAPGQQYWRVAKARWWNEQESQGRHHIYVEALDESGNPLNGVRARVEWPNGLAQTHTNGRSGFDAGNFPMSRSLNEFIVDIGDGVPSEVVTGIGMGADGNSGIHTSTGIVFQRVKMPAATTPTQPTPAPEQPAPTPPKETPMPTGIIDPLVAQAILKIESGGRTHGENGKPIIRFEAHIFKRYLDNDEVWSAYFRTDSNKPWTNQEWRPEPDAAWRPIHTGKQADEYTVLNAANFMAQLYSKRDAPYKSISMGAGQIMGFNHARVGYPSAEAMFRSFQDATVQTIAFINFFLSDPGLVDAMRRKDWREIAKRYNGAGQIDVYSRLLQNAYEQLGGQ